jgi:copper(I)-binding protein
MIKEGIVLLLFCTVIGCLGIGGEPNIKVLYPEASKSIAAENTIAIFMFIDNTGDGGDTLISARIVECPDSKVELNDVVNGRMVMIDEIEIPADAVVELKGGGYHVMGFDIEEPIDEFTLVLNFEKSGEIETVVEMPEMDKK